MAHTSLFYLLFLMYNTDMENGFEKSVVARRNILNNSYALSEIEDKVDIKGVPFEGETRLTIQQIASFFEVTPRTIERYIRRYNDELTENGYEVVSGERLKKFYAGSDIDVGTNTEKMTRQGLFTLKTFLNIAMLLNDSPKAKQLRTMMLNITTNTITRLAGGDTKYINQRDEKFLLASYYNEGYNKKLRDALKNYVTDSNDTAKYPNYNDKVYKVIFKENAAEYKRLLELGRKDKIRETLYAEVLSAISSFENTVAEELKNKRNELQRSLTRDEADEVFEKTAKHPSFEPQIEFARRNMASLDNGLRNKRHENLGEYIYPLNKEDYERFLGEKSKALSERIDDNLKMLKRLKDK